MTRLRYVYRVELPAEMDPAERDELLDDIRAEAEEMVGLHADDFDVAGAFDDPEPIDPATFVYHTPEPLTDRQALDLLNHMLSADEWSVSMLEDAAAIVRATGREEVPGVEWETH